MKLILPYEVRPYRVTQAWGVSRPDVYAQFGFKQHNGVDVAHGERSEVRAPFDFEVQKILWQPNGGGHVVGIVSQDTFEGPGGKECYIQVDFMHNARIVLPVGYKGSAGEVVCIAGNTGFSTGPHTHIRHKWMIQKGARLVDAEKNGAQNTFDPEPYRNGMFAADLIRQSHFPFSKDLYLGITDPEVKELQKFLNGQGFTVSLFGHGSKGFETETFGARTQKALIRFQQERGVNPPLGYFGPLTRAYISTV